MKYIDADRLKAEIEKVYKSEIQPWLSGVSATSAIYDYVLPLINSLQQEQPEVDLEKEIDRFYGMYRKDGKTFDLTDNEQCVDWKMDCNPDFEIEFARHFYELGCRRTAEKYDEIEYNRQKAEEQGSKGLEEEIIKCWQEWISPSNKQSVEGVLPLSEFAFYARHFAQWGAEHFRDPTKMISGSSEIPKDLEEASSKFATHIASNGVSVEFLEEKLSFQEGAKWQKEQDDKELSEKIVAAYQLGLADKEKQMLNEAVEGFIFQSTDYYPKQLIAGYDGELGMGDKVRIIILPKED